MAETELGKREKIQILLAEYSSLRTEINARISSTYQVVGIGAALIAWLLQQPIGSAFWIGLSIAAVGALLCVRFLTYDGTNAAVRVRELETQINELVGEKLLLWESERGGLNAGYWWNAFFLKPSTTKLRTSTSKP